MSEPTRRGGDDHGKDKRKVKQDRNRPNTAFPTPPSSHKSGGRPKDLIRSFWQKTLKQKNLEHKTLSLGPALAGPSTLNTQLHALNCTAFASASAADNILPKGPGPRAV